MPARVDAFAATALRSGLQKLIEEGGKRLLLDMSVVRLIDSSGLGVIVTASKAAKGIGGSVALFALPERVRSIIELTRLHLVFDIYPEEAAALAATQS
jgi:anti-sigma B factor antagonist